MIDRGLFCGGLIQSVLMFISAQALAAGWQSTVSREPPGNFPAPPPLKATYHFGWSGLTAATAEARFSKLPGDRFQLEASGRTIGLARFLWKYDVNYRSIVNGNTLRPIESKQTDIYRSKKVATQLTFSNAGVHRVRNETPGGAGEKPRDFDFSNLFDLLSTGLYLRSQPLKEGTVYRVVVYPATSAYLATFTVAGREKNSVRAGSYKAIKLDLQLQKVGKNLALEPHKKFRRASIWLSDDNARIPIRAEVHIFIGTVFAELQSVQINRENPKSI
jgi:hypothetical protein